MHRCYRYGRVLACGCAVAVAGTQKLPAQEALRTALQSDAAARLRGQPVVRPSANVLRWGPATFDVSLGYSLEATDNATFQRTERHEDLIQRPLLNLGILFHLSPQARLDFRTGAGYEDYIDNSVEDRFFITPGSEVALDVRIGNGIVTLFDRFDYSQDVVQEGALSGVGRFPRLENTIGLRSVWRFDKWVYQAGYSHLNVLIMEDDASATTTDFSYLERADEQFFGRAGYNFDNPVQLGVEATVSLSDYTAEVQRDRNTVSAGPYLTWTPADAMEVTVRGGAAYTQFDATGSLDETDNSSFYAGFDVDHRLTDHVTYAFSVTHDIRGGINAGTDYIETTRVDFDLTWSMMRHLMWSSLVFGELSEEVALSEAGGEKYSRFGTSVGPAYQITDHLSCFARYAFTIRDSDIESRSYRENRVTIGGTYRF
jgi:hypothetical protein